MAPTKRMRAVSPEGNRKSYKIGKPSSPRAMRRSTRLKKKHKISPDSLQLPSPEVSSTQATDCDNQKTSPAITAKRKRTPASGDKQDEPATKKQCTNDIQSAVTFNAPPEDEKKEDTPVFTVRRPDDHPVAHWAIYGEWPGPEQMASQQTADVGIHPPPPPPPRNKRNRSHSNGSYTSGVKSGDCPQAWTKAHEELMAQKGLVMAQFLNSPKMHIDSITLCTEIREVSLDDLPTGTLFDVNIFDAALERVGQGTEARVQRDFTPLIVPPAEVLYMISPTRYPHFQYMSEEVWKDWKFCTTLEGPVPRPDYTIGISSSAFTHEELGKVQSSYGWVAENIFFPFLICELKVGNDDLSIAQRQSMHAASIAVDAIVKLHQAAGLEKEVSAQALVFSVSHNASEVRIHAHYALVGGGKEYKFYRHELFAASLIGSGDGRSQWTPYKIVMNIYSTFFPKHLKRIRHALTKWTQQNTAPLTNGLKVGTGTRAYTDADNTSAVTKPSTQAQEREAELIAQVTKLSAQLDRTAAQLQEEAQERETELMAQVTKLSAQLSAQLQEGQERQVREREEAIAREQAREREATIAREREAAVAREQAREREEMFTMMKQLKETREREQEIQEREQEIQEREREIQERERERERERAEEQKKMFEAQIEQLKDFIAVLKK